MIELKHLNKRYSDFVALRDVSLTIAHGELIALLGPSGSGKTTLLRMISGLDVPDSGEVIMGGKHATSGSVAERKVGFVFQHYALFKHMTVFENVAFGLRVRPKAQRLSEEKIREKVMQLLGMVHLDTLHGRFPSQLSGGQRQRVALARALAVEPSVLLLDEPFGALDAKVRKELRRWMRRLHEELNITSVFVTHDQEEAMEMADRVVVMSQGRIEQVGTPEQVYLSPSNAFVYDFLGHYNEFAAWQLPDGTLLLQEGDQVEHGRAAVSSGLLGDASRRWLKEHLPTVTRLLSGLTHLAEPVTSKPETQKPAMGAAVKVFCRPHELYIHKTREAGTVAANIIHLNPAGPLVKLELERPNGGLLDAELQKTVLDTLNLQRGDTVYVRPKEMKVFS